MSKKLLFVAIASILATGAYAEPATITTQDYVDNKFQTKIPATVKDDDLGVTKTLVSTTDTAGEVGQVAILDTAMDSSWPFWQDPTWSPWEDYNEYLLYDNAVPSYNQLMWDEHQLRVSKQPNIDRSGSFTTQVGYGPHGGSSSIIVGPNNWDNAAWLRNDVKGTGLVTKTSTEGIVGERKIIETADVANYGTGTATQQQIQEISIPTMGAVMAAISNNQVTLPTGTAGNVVTYNSNGAIGGSVATYNGSTTYNASTDASKIAVMSAVQRKKTCARYVQNADQTAENCLLWNLPD